MLLIALGPYYEGGSVFQALLGRADKTLHKEPTAGIVASLLKYICQRLLITTHTHSPYLKCELKISIEF